MSARRLTLLALYLIGTVTIACGSAESDTNGTAGSTSHAGASATAGASGGSGPSEGGSGLSTTPAGSTGSADGGTVGGGTGGGGTVGGSGALPDPSKNLLDLTAAEKAALCDWVENANGGYGVTVQCSDGKSIETYADQATCVSRGLHYLCTIVTVGDVQTCTEARVPSRGCDTPAPACN